MLQSIPRPALLAGAGVIAAVIVIALVSMLFGGPTEVSEREWARGLCKKIEKESKKIEDLDDESDSLDPYSDSPSERETREVLEFYTSLVDLRVTTAKNIESYNDGHVVDDREGEDMREDIADDVKKLHEDLKDMRKVLGDLDPKDREDAISDMFDILSDDVDVSSNADPYSEVSLEIYDDDDCVAAHGLFG